MSGRPAGMLVIDKPRGQTSHDVVEEVRRLLHVRAGHAGTLDPQATGVLLVCTGAATRLARFLQSHDKVYEGVIRLGWATETYDAEGEVLGPVVSPPPFERSEVDDQLQRFVGVIEQRPPAYSAKKVRGQPAYRRARRGEAVSPEPQRVTIYEARLLALDEARIHVRVHCGPGTYLRSLAHELGEALGCPAHLERLRRLSSGPFGLARAVTWDRLAAMAGAEAATHLIAPAEMLPEMPAATLDAEGEKLATNGGLVEPRRVVQRRGGAGEGNYPAAGSGGQWIRLLSGDGRLVGVAEQIPGGLLQPRVVLR